MTTKLIRALTALSLLAATLAVGSAARPVTTPSQASEHQRIVEFWTNERVAQAIPRDFILTPGKGYLPAKPGGGGGKPGGGGGKPGGGGSTTVLGASWKGAENVFKTTGKVLFALGNTYYVCSASTVADTVTKRSIVLTAGHCAYDETAGGSLSGFATNWMYIPDYDAAPAPLTTSGLFCDNTLYGCWTASSLVVAKEFATAGGFNDQAVLHDYAFAVVGPGGKDNTELDSTLGSQSIAYTTGLLNDDTYAFGYPAAGKYKGNDLVYCRGPLEFDPHNNDLTYRLGCKMTGGSSGGGWFRDFKEGSGTGTLFSVNSYGYSGVTAMHGPFFNTETSGMYGVARTTDGNVIYQLP